jgi:hypothetical protein
MNAALRIFSGLLLALTLSVGSLQMALARTAPVPVGEMVLCTGNGPITVAVDADGNPTGQVHYCPESAAVSFAALEIGAAVLPQPAGLALPLQGAARTETTTPQASICPQSREPPLSI